MIYVHVLSFVTKEAHLYCSMFYIIINTIYECINYSKFWFYFDNVKTKRIRV